MSLFFIGLFLWVAGALDAFGTLTLLSLGALMAGSLQTVTAGYLLNTPASGRRERSPAEGAGFCLAFAAGLAAIGFAVSPATTWLSPAIDFLIGGLLLIFWSPQALRHRGMPGN